MPDPKDFIISAWHGGEISVWCPDCQWISEDIVGTPTVGAVLALIEAHHCEPLTISGDTR